MFAKPETTDWINVWVWACWDARMLSTMVCCCCPSWVTMFCIMAMLDAAVCVLACVMAATAASKIP